MCIKGQVSLVIGKQRQRERLQKIRWVDEEAGLRWPGTEVAAVTGKCTMWYNN